MAVVTCLADSRDGPGQFTCALGNVHRRKIPLSAIQQQGGIPPVEGLAEIRGEGGGPVAVGGTGKLCRVSPTEGVKCLRIGFHRIHHVGSVLEPSFNLERTRTRARKVFQASEEIHIAKGEERLAAHQRIPFSVHQVV